MRVHLLAVAHGQNYCSLSAEVSNCTLQVQNATSFVAPSSLQLTTTATDLGLAKLFR